MKAANSRTVQLRTIVCEDGLGKANSSSTRSNLVLHQVLVMHGAVNFAGTVESKLS